MAKPCQFHEFPVEWQQVRDTLQGNHVLMAARRYCTVCGAVQNSQMVAKPLETWFTKRPNPSLLVKETVSPTNPKH